MSERDPTEIIRAVRLVLDGDSDDQAKVYAVSACVLTNADWTACMYARSKHPEDRSAAEFAETVRELSQRMNSIEYTAPEIRMHAVQDLARLVLRPCEVEVIMAARAEAS